MVVKLPWLDRLVNSLSCDSKRMVLEDVGLQKLVGEKNGVELGPKRWCKGEQPMNQNGGQMGAIIQRAPKTPLKLYPRINMENEIQNLRAQITRIGRIKASTIETIAFWFCTMSYRKRGQDNSTSAIASWSHSPINGDSALACTGTIPA